MVVHFYLGQNDKDLLAWKKALPKMTFSWYIREIIRADRKGMVLELPLETATVEDGEEYDTKLYFTGREEITFIRTVPKGRRNKRIKEVIRRHIEANRQYLANQVAENSAVSIDTENGAPKSDMSDEYEEMLRRMAGK